MPTPSSTLLREIADRLGEARKNKPASLSTDGSGVMICGDVGGAAYIRADGSIFTEPWDDVPDNQFRREDPGFLNSLLVVGAKRWAALGELLPDRPLVAADCDKCSGSGWLKFGTTELVCSACNGLGWRSAA